ncbi:hypothetical protein PI126_g20228 [Phytophthora idaei]|nr:hypothetical protein PI126_g20228 [Phytophthora idaei]
MESNSQAEWTALENKYRTPPVPEKPRLKARRNASRRQTRARLQRRQIARLVEAQRVAAIAAGASPNVALTQAEQAVLARRFASPAPPEDPAARLRRHASRTRSERLLETRTTAHRLRLARDEPTHAAPSAASYEQLAAAVLYLSPNHLAMTISRPDFQATPNCVLRSRTWGLVCQPVRRMLRNFPRTTSSLSL